MFQISLIFSLPRTASVRAVSHCDLMILEKVDVQNVLEYYPEGRYIYHIVPNFFLIYNKNKNLPLIIHWSNEESHFKYS